MRREGWAAAVLLRGVDRLGQPELWPIALLGFLVRGGFLVVVLPIVVLPTPVGLFAFAGLHVLTIAGDPTPQFVIGVAVTVVVFLVWLIGGGLIGAAVDVELVRAVAEAGEGGPGTARGGLAPSGSEPRGRLLTRLLAARLVTLLPLAAALGWWGMRIGAAAYQELTVPLDLATPVVVRAFLDAIDAAILVGVAWLFVEAYGSLVVRRLLLDDSSVGGALAGSFRDLVTAPVSSLLTLLAAEAGSLLLIAPPLAAAAVAWDRFGYLARAGIGSPIDLVAGPPAAGAPGPLTFWVALLLLCLLVGSWLGALALAGAASSWRSALWTLEGRRRTRSPELRIGERAADAGDDPAPDAGNGGAPHRPIGTAPTRREGA